MRFLQDVTSYNKPYFSNDSYPLLSEAEFDGALTIQGPNSLLIQGSRVRLVDSINFQQQAPSLTLNRKLSLPYQFAVGV